MLFEIAKHVPQAFPYFNEMYGSISNMWVFGFNDIIRKIPSGVGVHQGDVVATWGYSMGTLPFFRKITHILNPPTIYRSIDNVKGVGVFFIDDGNTASTPSTTIEAIRYIKTKGKYYGYELNMKKGSLCMAKFPTNDLAMQHFNNLVSEGLDPEIIHMHPDNVSPEETFIAQENYGMKILLIYMKLKQAFILK